MAVSSPESDRAGESSGARGWKGNLSGWEWRMTTGTGGRGATCRRQDAREPWWSIAWSDGRAKWRPGVRLVIASSRGGAFGWQRKCVAWRRVVAWEPGACCFSREGLARLVDRLNIVLRCNSRISR